MATILLLADAMSAVRFHLFVETQGRPLLTGGVTEVTISLPPRRKIFSYRLGTVDMKADDSLHEMVGELPVSNRSPVARGNRQVSYDA